MSERAPGAWQGEWLVTRNDPRLASKAGRELLRLTIIHSEGEPHAEVHWGAGRAICEDPIGEPCEWIGASGVALQAIVSAGSLLALLPVSADETDPMLLHLAPPQRNRPAQGTLLNTRGDLRYVVEAEPQATGAP